MGGPNQEIIPLRGSILQAETCQILSFAENPRWSPSVAIRMNPFREQLPLSRVSVFQSEEEVDLFSGLCCYEYPLCRCYCNYEGECEAYLSQFDDKNSLDNINWK